MAEKTKRIVQSPLELKGISKFLAFSCQRSLERGVWAFAELGLADLMFDYGKPITAKQLSQLNGNDCNAENLYRLLRVAADANLIEPISSTNETDKDEGHPEEVLQYQLTDDGLLLKSDDPSKIRDLMRVDLGIIADKTSVALPDLIRNGTKNGDGFTQAMGSKLFDFMQKEENKEYATLFNNAMIGYTHYTITFMGSNVDFTRFHRIVDIAGGLGTLLANILDKSPNSYGLLFDLPQVIEHAKSNQPNEFERKGISSDRYEFVVGDMFKSETISPADAYTLKFILHDWNDEKCIEILKSIRSANEKEKGKCVTVFIIEMVILSNDRDNWEAHVMDLEMLTNLDAKERSLQQYKRLFEQSGFNVKQLYRTNTFMSIIEASTTL